MKLFTSSKNKNFKNRSPRGQAALEFIMSYGWAMMIALVAMGSLAYMVSNPKNITPEKCTFSNFNCIGTKFGTEGLKIVLINSQPYATSIKSITLPAIAGSSCASDLTNVPTGEKFTISCINIPATITEATKFKVEMKYNKSSDASSYDKVSNGEVFSKYYNCGGFVISRKYSTGTYDNLYDTTCCSAATNCVSDNTCYGDTTIVKNPSWDPTNTHQCATTTLLS